MKALSRLFSLGDCDDGIGVCWPNQFFSAATSHAHSKARTLDRTEERPITDAVLMAMVVAILALYGNERRLYRWSLTTRCFHQKTRRSQMILRGCR